MVIYCILLLIHHICIILLRLSTSEFIFGGFTAFFPPHSTLNPISMNFLFLTWVYPFPRFCLDLILQNFFCWGLDICMPDWNSLWYAYLNLFGFLYLIILYGGCYWNDSFFLNYFFRGNLDFFLFTCGISAFVVPRSFYSNWSLELLFKFILPLSLTTNSAVKLFFLQALEKTIWHFVILVKFIFLEGQESSLLR